MRPDLRNIHSIPAGKVDAAVLDKIKVPDAYPHFTPFVENKSQVRVGAASMAALLWTWRLTDKGLQVQWVWGAV
jgi:hypothetical protein